MNVLAPGISFGLYEGRAIVLDLASDRYRLLSPFLTESLCTLGVAASPGLAPVAALRSLGLIGEPPGDLIAPVDIPRPTSSALESADATAGRKSGLVRIAASIVMVRRALRKRSLIDIVARERSRRASRSLNRDLMSAIAIAQDFTRTRPFVPIEPTCMLESFALGRVLVAHRVAHDLVFGVRLDPFAAHAWVQTDDCVLSDSVDHVAEYVPVFRL